MKALINIDNLKINNPCPNLPSRMKKEGDNFFCLGCNKTVVDFRNMTVEEIKLSISRGTCGIFTFNQLPGQRKMKFSKQLIYYFLTILSFLGFTVKPLMGQNTKTIKDTTLVDIKYDNNGKKIDNGKLKKTEQEKTRKHIFRRKKKYKRLGGCPDF